MRLDQLAAAKQALIYEGWVARTHAPDFPLVYASGPEYRDQTELDRILSQVETYSLATTLLHPSTLIKFGADDARIVGAIVGGFMDVRDGVSHVVARIAIWDAEAVEAIDAGVYELSLGYQAKLDDQSYQRDIVLDHLAIVPAGRCRTCELNPMRADGCEPDYRQDLGGAVARFVPVATTDEMQVTATFKFDAEGEKNLTRLETAFKRLDEMSTASTEHADCAPCAAAGHKCGGACNSRAMPHNAPESNTMDELKKQLDEALAALEAEKVAKAALEAEVSTLKSDAEKAKTDAELAAEKGQSDLELANNKIVALTAELAEANTKADAAAQTRADADAAEFTKRVNARVELLADAAKIGIDNAKDMTDIEIKLAAIKQIRGKDVADKADKVDFVDGMYVIAMDQFDASQASVAETRTAVKTIEDTATTDDTPDVEAEREAMLKRRNERFNKRN